LTPGMKDPAGKNAWPVNDGHWIITRAITMPGTFLVMGFAMASQL